GGHPRESTGAVGAPGAEGGWRHPVPEALMPSSAHIVHPSAPDAVFAMPADVARPLGATLLRVAAIALLGPPLAVLVALVAALALVTAGSAIAVGAVLVGFGLPALLAAGAAG